MRTELEEHLLEQKLEIYDIEQSGFSFFLAVMKGLQALKRDRYGK